VASLPVYDLCVTTKPFELELYKKFGARDVLLVLQGHGRRFKPHAPEDLIGSVYRSAVSFIGHRQSHYVRVLREVVKSGADLNVWGPGWPAYGRRAAWARRTVRGGPIWGADYPLALASAEIAIGLLSKYIPETTTTRSFEIPASGTFLLAERTPDHQALFDEGREAEFFGELDELVEKIRKYSRDKDARARIAAAGHRRSITSGYSMDVQMGNVLRHLDLRWPNRS
jgi:spore maturation protein CgeB